MNADDLLRRQLDRIVQSAALSADFKSAAFLARPESHLARPVAGFGALFSSVDETVYLRLSELITRSPGGVLLVDDVLTDCRRPPGGHLPLWRDRRARAFAAVHVGDDYGGPIGLLIVADPQTKPGMSAAQTYVLKTQAAQLADSLALHSLKLKGATSRSGNERLRLLESVVINAKDSILITEAEPFNLPGPRIVYCNAAFEEATGYTQAEVLGKTPRILQGPGTDPLGTRRIRAALEQWKPIEIEVLNYKKSGEPFWVELSIVPVADEAGWYTHWVSVQRDVTERKNAEEVRTRVRIAEANNAGLQTLTNELRLALDAAEAANVAKSQFLANMSHEIRTPLNGVLGMTQALWTAELTDVQRERVAIIRESGRALLAVLNDVLDLSKIEAGRLELELIAFDLQDVARGVCAAFTEQANRGGVSFGLTVDEKAIGVWRGDSVRLRQILYNLISNALKFTSAGEVRVALDLTLERALRIRVSDTGIGIAADKLGELFSKFYQSDSSNTRRFGGTGLGLAICRQLCDLMNGEISVESVEGQGSTFTVVLPLQQLSDGSAPPMETPEPPSWISHDDTTRPSASTLRILAAEDNLSNQLVLRALLQSFDVTPTIVGNGALAVETWKREPFDLILMDVQMPEMDGVTATRLIRADESENQLARTPIVALSANAMTHQIREYLEAGMDGHLAKPLDIEHLADLLSRVESEAGTAPAVDEEVERKRA
jgi:PAS domain S-box-containing protein